MSIETIQAELVRLQLHPVNLDVSARDDRLVALQGSLLHYWKAPAIIDGRWFLRLLRSLPDAAGPEVVMSALCKGQPVDHQQSEADKGPTALKLFDPQTKSAETRSVAIKKGDNS